jgi:hypothetical protein
MSQYIGEKEHLDVLMREWEAIRTALLYFGNRRFAQFTVFLAVTTALFKGFLDSEGSLKEISRAIFQDQLPLLIAITGIALTVIFLAMECLSVYRRDIFALRAKRIEKDFDYLYLMHVRPNSTIMLEAWGIYAVHIIILMWWLWLLVRIRINSFEEASYVWLAICVISVSIFVLLLWAYFRPKDTCLWPPKK